MQLNITEKKLKDSSRIMRNMINTTESSTIGHQQALQIMSQALFSKPYEEVKATLLSGKREKSQDPSKNDELFVPILILKYGSKSILTSQGEIVVIRSPDSDADTSESGLREVANQQEILYRKPANSYREVHLPEVLPTNCNVEDIINLAEAMGYFRYQKTIFDLMDTTDLKIFIEGRSCPYGLNGNYEGDIQAAIENQESPLGQCIWYAECEQGGDLYEYFFTFGDLLAARSDDGRNWIVPHADKYSKVHIELIV